MADGDCFELHTFQTTSGWCEETFELWQIDELPHEDGQLEVAQVLAIDKTTKLPLRVTHDGSTGHLVASESAGVLAEFQIVQRPLGAALGMLALSSDILVNGVQALAFTVLSPKDALVLSPGLHTYVTERIVPFVGPPPEALIGQRCPHCRIPIDDDTRVVTHRCGVAYHWETAESHPHVGEDDRLNCFEKVRACLSCTRPMTLDEELLWDPASL